MSQLAFRFCQTKERKYLDLLLSRSELDAICGWLSALEQRPWVLHHVDSISLSLKNPRILNSGSGPACAPGGSPICVLDPIRARDRRVRPHGTLRIALEHNRSQELEEVTLIASYPPSSRRSGDVSVVTVPRWVFFTARSCFTWDHEEANR